MVIKCIKRSVLPLIRSLVRGFIYVRILRVCSTHTTCTREKWNIVRLIMKFGGIKDGYKATFYL